MRGGVEGNSLTNLDHDSKNAEDPFSFAVSSKAVSCLN